MKDIHCIMTICIVASLGCRSDDRSGAVSVPEPYGQVYGTPPGLRTVQRKQAEPLYDAVLRDDLDAVRRLVANGADVNQDVGDGVTPLHAATRSDSEQAFEIVKLLLSHGADVNAKVKSDDVSGGGMHMAEGCTPLHNATNAELVGECNKDVVELLLIHGANVNERDGYGYTPLIGTVFPGSPDIMDLLIAHGADVNAKNGEDGGTALHEAAYYGGLDIIALLISHGANVNARDSYGETPLHRAALRESRDVVDYLVAHGGDLHTRSKRDETPQDFLDEPNAPEPIILADSTERVFSCIITDGLLIRRMLKSRSIDYDSLWLPTPSAIDGLRPSLRQWLEKKTPHAKNVYVNHDRILRHFDQYDREYGGFTKNGRKHILCNMVHFRTDPASRPPRSRFFGMFDGGCSWVFVVFEAQTRRVVEVRCNNV